MGKRGNGEGSITRRNDGRWMGQVSVGRDKEAGRLIRQTFYGRTRQEVAEKLSMTVTAASQGLVAPTRTLMLGEWLERWHVTYAKPKVRQSTWESYGQLIRLYIAPALGGVRLRDLRPEHLQRFYLDQLDSGAILREGGLSPRTVQYLHAVLHQALKQAVREALVTRNVADAVSPPRQIRHEVHPPTAQDMRKLLEAARGHRLNALFLLAWATGARRGELLALRWSDTDLDKGTVTITRNLIRTKAQGLVFTEPKTSLSRRTVPIPDVARRELRAHKARQNEERLLVGSAYKDGALVFALADGAPVDPSTASHTFNRVLEKAGLPHYRFHDMRHAFATALLELGEHPKIVQTLLGHSTIAQTLNTYSHVTPGLTERAVARLGDAMETALGSGLQ